jgi:prepilin-type N-terminal cleavage/methylation domain-containing protein
MQTKVRQSGFTLVEIAIVLVIIGLLLGGILKGQEMITQARIKNVINDFNGITAAYASYQDRYKAIPGDDGNAASRWVAPPLPLTAVSGNGNGQVAGAYNAYPAGAVPVAAEESNLFWWHLRLSGFIAGPTSGATFANPPNNAVGGIVGVTTGDGTAGMMGFSGLIVCSSNLADKIAISIDTQIDDQNAATGGLRGMVQAGANPNIGAVAASYQETGSNQYLLCKTM